MNAAMTDTTTTSATRSNADVVERFFEAGYVRCDFDEVMAIVSPDYTDHSPCAAHGNHACVDVLRDTARMFHDIQVDIRDVVASGDRVAVRVAFVVTHAADAYGIPATGRRISFEALEMFRVRNGRIVESWGYWPDAQIRSMLIGDDR